MSNKLTDNQIIEAIRDIAALEHDAHVAVIEIARLLPPTVATNDDMYDAFKAGYDLGYAKAEAGR